MPIGWIDFSKDERNKVLSVINILEEPEAIDELGIGVIRDAFADVFFPGTSTIQTRAKYFLIVPYILKEAGSGSYGSDLNSILQRIDYEERHCRDILIKTDSSGVIGSLVPNSWVLRAPSNIYWNGIKKLRIFKEDLSVKEYIHQSIIQRNLKKAKEYGNRTRDAEENEKDDFDAGDITTIQFWNLGGLFRSDWRENLTIELLPDEALFLKSQIINNQRDSLFAFILKNNISLDKYESFGALSEDIKDDVDHALRHLLELANDFNDLVSIITTRFNLIVFGGENTRAKDSLKRYEIVGMIVNHKQYGDGIITKSDKSYTIVQFHIGEKKFQTSTVFEGGILVSEYSDYLKNIKRNREIDEEIKEIDKKISEIRESLNVLIV